MKMGTNRGWTLMDTDNPEAQWDSSLHPRQSASIRGSNFQDRSDPGVSPEPPLE
jgi:hypothetical protein